MLITRGYRTELDLNNKQITLRKKHAGCARFAYNWGLAHKQEVYRQTGHNMSAMELHKELNTHKQTDYPWMYEVSKSAPQEALRDLDTAFRHFFRRCKLKRTGKWKGKKLGFPKFKTKRVGLGSLRLKERGYLPTSGVHIMSATVSEEAGRWFVSIRVEEEVPDPVPASGDPIGIAIENPKALRSQLKRLKRLHRRLSRRKKGSNNRAKARIRLTRTYARVAHIRRDALHKGTSRLTRARLSPEVRADRLAPFCGAGCQTSQAETGQTRAPADDKDGCCDAPSHRGLRGS